jgi:hypothetical protein
MTDLRQAAQQALDALKAHQPVAYRMNGRNEKFPIYECDPLKQSRTASAITALEAALAAQQPEPQYDKIKAERDAAVAALKWALKKGVSADLEPGRYSDAGCGCCSCEVEIPDEHKAAIDAARGEA